MTVDSVPPSSGEATVAPHATPPVASPLASPLASPSSPATAAAGMPVPRARGGTSEHSGDSRLRASLSPSRAADFKTCPLLFRLRSIDRLPEPATPDQARGTLVHAVLERLFDLEAVARTPDAAAALVAPQWERLLGEDPDLTGVVEAETIEAFLASAGDLLTGYFSLEDPRRLAPAERESLVCTEVDEGRLQLRGYIDRLDIAPDGSIRVVDYKTGGAPREAFEARALFQLKFYALVLWRTRGVVPAVLRLIYLKDREVCDFRPDPEELLRFERTLIALWAAINQAREAGEFQATPSKLCGWCAFQALCPAYGGTPPPYPADMGAIAPETTRFED